MGEHAEDRTQLQVASIAQFFWPSHCHILGSSGFCAYTYSEEDLA